MVHYLSREERRQQILDAAVQLVVREGLAAATVRRIAQELSCSPGQLHHHFPETAALRAEAVREVWRRLEPMFLPPLHQLAPRRRLMALLAGAAGAETPELLEPLTVAERLWHEAWESRREGPVRAALIAALGNLRHEVIAALRHGRESGAFRGDGPLEPMASRLIAAAQGHTLLEELGFEGHARTDRLAFIEGVLQREGL